MQEERSGDMAHLVECLPKMHGVLWILQNIQHCIKWGMTVHTKIATLGYGVLSSCTVSSSPQKTGWGQQGRKEGRLASKLNRGKVWNPERKFWHPSHIAPVLTRAVRQLRLGDSSSQGSALCFLAGKFQAIALTNSRKQQTNLTAPNSQFPQT